MDFTHINENGNAVMVDVTSKEATERVAKASGSIYMSDECFEKLVNQQIKKGDVLACARVAGIMGAKKTSELIPLCHIINLTKAEVDFELCDESKSVKACCVVKTFGKTGVEMEALTGLNVALLTIYDMCKAIDKRMHIEDIHLDSKTGGKSGDFIY